MTHAQPSNTPAGAQAPLRLGRRSCSVHNTGWRSIAVPLAAVLAWMPMQANAVIECNVKVSHVLIYRDGTVNVLHSGRGDYTHICNLNAERQGVSPMTCAMWATMLQHIKKNNGTASFYYEGEGSCATLPVYASSPAPVYIGNMAGP